MKKPSVLYKISFRLLLFNLLIVFVPLSSIIFLSTYEEQLLQSLERSMVQQGRILAAALGDTPALTEEKAAALLQRLQKRHDARLRVLDTAGRVLSDSSVLPEEKELSDIDSAYSMDKWSGRSLSDPGEEQPPDESWLYKLASFPVRLLRNYLLPPAVPLGSGDYYLGKELLLGREVLDALEGRYGAATRISSGGQISVTLYSALPVHFGERITGVVLVSQSTYRILQDLYRLRLDLFKIFLISILTAVLISLFLSFTISRPLKTLSRQAQRIFIPGGKFQGRFYTGGRMDEIGQLAYALDRLSDQLKEHIEFIESFASDVSHELKNPLAAIRSSAEVAAETLEDSQEAVRFLSVIQREAARMEHLLSALRDITTIDTRLPDEEKESVDLVSLATLIVQEYRQVTPEIPVSFIPDLPKEKMYVSASPLRLTQAIKNIIDNAVSFSPPGGEITLKVGRKEGFIFLELGDRGPGIPPKIMDKIFQRFFSSRCGTAKGDHTGLGLAIVKAVVTGYGGTVGAKNREGGGALITFRLPEST
ncbi:MAG: histidine kinase [Spirochaetales bacterium]|nr:histidine kinase [Spirochaetales bacterium]